MKALSPKAYDLASLVVYSRELVESLDLKLTADQGAHLAHELRNALTPIIVLITIQQQGGEVTGQDLVDAMASVNRILALSKALSPRSLV